MSQSDPDRARSADCVTLVATYLTLNAFEHFSTKSWDDLRANYLIITNLEPRDESHWVSVIWHIGINATANMEIDTRLPAFERERRFKEYAFQAIELGERGISQIPGSVAIRLQLAEVYREKLKDDCATARIYGTIIGLPGEPAYARRFYGISWPAVPGGGGGLRLPYEPLSRGGSVSVYQLSSRRLRILRKNSSSPRSGVSLRQIRISPEKGNPLPPGLFPAASLSPERHGYFLFFRPRRAD